MFRESFVLPVCTRNMDSIDSWHRPKNKKAAHVLPDGENSRGEQLFCSVSIIRAFDLIARGFR